MGVFKFFKKKNNETAPSEDNGEVSARPNRPSLRRRISNESMRRLRAIGACLRVIGDDIQRRSEKPEDVVTLTDDGQVNDKKFDDNKGNTSLVESNGRSNPHGKINNSLSNGKVNE